MFVNYISPTFVSGWSVCVQVLGAIIPNQESGGFISATISEHGSVDI